MYSWKSAMLLSFTSLQYPYWRLRSPLEVYLQRHFSQGPSFQFPSFPSPSLLLYPPTSSTAPQPCWANYLWCDMGNRSKPQVSWKIIWRKTNNLFLTWTGSLNELIPHHNRCINTPEGESEQTRLQLSLTETNVSISWTGMFLKYSHWSTGSRTGELFKHHQMDLIHIPYVVHSFLCQFG